MAITPEACLLGRREGSSDRGERQSTNAAKVSQSSRDKLRDSILALDGTPDPDGVSFWDQLRVPAALRSHSTGIRSRRPTPTTTRRTIKTRG
jgi:hypothetical protein